MAELLRCPFCGAEAKINYKAPLDTWIVECSNQSCIASYMLGYDYDTKAEAIEAWNRRHKADDKRT